MKLHSTILGEGKALLILHGFLGMSDNWKTIGKKYSEEGFEVHLVDLRNHGRSPHSDNFNYEIMAEDVVEYCSSHNLQSLILVGHSMGGKVAMQAAVNNPRLVEKLIVVDIAPKYYAPHHQEILEGLKAVEEANLDSRGEAEDILAKYVPDEGTKLFLLKNLYWKSKGSLALRLNLDSLLKNVDHIGEALPAEASYSNPTLFVKGAQSNYIKKEDEQEIKRQFSNSKIVSIPNAGHWVHAENMDAFYEESMKFMQA